jgi:hypothetical protein
VKFPGSRGLRPGIGPRRFRQHLARQRGISLVPTFEVVAASARSVHGDITAAATGAGPTCGLRCVTSFSSTSANPPPAESGHDRKRHGRFATFEPPTAGTLCRCRDNLPRSTLMICASSKGAGHLEASRQQRSLSLSRSSVSRSVARLEEALGTRLIHRTTRQVELTVAGRSLLSRCAGALGVLDDAFDDIGVSRASRTASCASAPTSASASSLRQPALMQMAFPLQSAASP